MAVFGIAMVNLPRAVEKLVATTTGEVDPRTLKGIVEKVLDAFAPAPAKDQTEALRSIGRALKQAEGRGAQVLSLALGALVEGGASPEFVWPSVADRLGTLLDRATTFASAAVAVSGLDEVEPALEAVGAQLAKERPKDAAAWKAVPARCLAAVACLTRSKKLRAKMRRDEDLLESTWPLADVVAEVGDLLQALRIVDDETMIVLAPELGRGWKVTLDAMPSNAELYVLLADALAIDGQRPNPKLVAALQEGTHLPRAASVKIPFHLVPWTAVTDDDWVRMEGIPADIPAFGNERVVLLRKAPYGKAIPIAPSFESLAPRVRVVADIDAKEVELHTKKLDAKRAPASKSKKTKAAANTKTAKAGAKKTAGAAKKPAGAKKTAGAKKRS